MLESVRRLVSIPQVSTEIYLSAGTILGFSYLLLTDQIHPVAIYLLQLYLSF